MSTPRAVHITTPLCRGKHDLEAGMGLMRTAFSLGDFTVIETPLALKTPSGQKSLRVRVALAWVGALQVELIQPISGYVEPYLSALPADPKDSVPRSGEPGTPGGVREWGPDLTCIFVDARQRIGHHLEFVFATIAGWEMVGWPKGMAVR